MKAVMSTSTVFEAGEPAILTLKEKQSIERELYLYSALYRTNGTGYFTSGERICINQERGYHLSVGGEEELKLYQISSELEEKIARLRDRR
ncbi:hypothetical protein HX082_11325 [Myroides odoratimimus]|uniref:hypothetical protein n=1 Tax=Myroides odoratimimus TaxID=76832 RepID=UPI002578A728|nr:hypothetical protein [Myroides odoratimimus]MDM1509987.1 hypothetical protein [Myroides odoratimimus]MDM1524569.1 hypothetical protein [Myroides odoratimimus]MDM1677985.1 hypothetical protein [Myroides odoratimimus]MEC4033500.1 hypothetical protein [Myroides odoratimimus]MEC4092810.1 hypothetical protein [Myroides odoratimimus]